MSRRLDRNLAALIALGVLAPARGGPSPTADLAHTYSIVARDPETGDMGVAVQSHWLGVGALCAWGRAGVGVIATQAKTDPRYGVEGLDRLAEGLSPREAHRALAAGDPEPEARQVALLDASGRVHAHTGSRCIPVASHRIGQGFSVQANLMVDDGVVPAMARGYRESRGPLAERLLAALAAAQEAGGDLRGAQAAAVLVVRGQATGELLRDRPVDLRVDDHPHPVEELRRLLRARRALDGWQAAESLLASGDALGALRRFREARRADHGNREIRFWFALSLARAGHMDAARPLMSRLLARAPAWETVLRRLPGTSVLPDTPRSRRLLEELTATEGPVDGR